jgi:hypothetical protein
MANKDIILGRVINITGMIGVLAGTVLFTFAIVLILFRRGFGNSIHWFWQTADIVFYPALCVTAPSRYAYNGPRYVQRTYPLQKTSCRFSKPTR